MQGFIQNYASRVLALIVSGILVLPTTLALPVIGVNSQINSLNTSASSNSLNKNSQLNYGSCISSECQKASERIQKSLDKTVNPCEDFYEFACGGWIAEQKQVHQNTGKTSTTQFSLLNDKMDLQIQGNVTYSCRFLFHCSDPIPRNYKVRGLSH